MRPDGDLPRGSEAAQAPCSGVKSIESGIESVGICIAEIWKLDECPSPLAGAVCSFLGQRSGGGGSGTRSEFRTKVAGTLRRAVRSGSNDDPAAM